MLSRVKQGVCAGVSQGVMEARHQQLREEIRVCAGCNRGGVWSGECGCVFYMMRVKCGDVC